MNPQLEAARKFLEYLEKRNQAGGNPPPPPTDDNDAGGGSGDKRLEL